MPATVSTAISMALLERVGIALLAALACTAALPATPASSSASTPAATPAPISAAARAAAPFAVVGDIVIKGADYQRTLAIAMRKKYYHAKPPESEVAKFQREVGEEMVDRVLLMAEARKRGVKPDAEKIKATIAGYDAQYKGSANWAANREKMLAAVVPQLEADSIYERFEKLVKAVPEPGDEAARAYYEQHKDLFVEPEQVKLGVIVLRVDPSSTPAVWASARAEAQRIHAKIARGADFAELARLHSNDRSAPNGGAMDYTHRGMLPEAVHGVVDTLAVGAMSEPVRMLEGYALIRVDGRKPAIQRTLEQVKERAGDLWQRDEGLARWRRLIAELRRATTIRIDESHYAPLRGPTDKPRAG